MWKNLGVEVWTVELRFFPVKKMLAAKSLGSLTRRHVVGLGFKHDLFNKTGCESVLLQSSQLSCAHLEAPGS